MSGSKPPLVTRIVRTGQGTGLKKTLIDSLNGGAKRQFTFHATYMTTSFKPGDRNQPLTALVTTQNSSCRCENNHSVF